ncbi:MAG: hypothetical protein U5N85_10545 [Arcicella sp.]|nr:hypothetical protein [Arcicella sp.]
MKQHILKVLLLVATIMTHNALYAHVLITSEEGRFMKNPIRHNGSSFDYRSFTLQSKGKLSLVKGDPNDEKAKKIPFTVYLKRNGEMFFVGQFLVQKDVYEVEISEVLAYAFGGDELILEPTRKEDRKAKQIIRLKRLEFWLINRDGC